LREFREVRQDADGRDRDVARPDPESLGVLRIVSAPSTASQLSSGSPIPMNTTLVGFSAARASITSRT